MLSVEVSAAVNSSSCTQSSNDDNKINLLHLDTGMNLPDVKSDDFFNSLFPACQLLY